MKTRLIPVYGALFVHALSTIALGAQSPFTLMQVTPEPATAQRCGLRSLYEVARVLKPGDSNVAGILKVPSLEEVLSMDELASLSEDFQLGLMPVKRVCGQELPVPSVAHWGRDHYVAILGKQGENYRVFDPAFDKARWLSASGINSEITGQFLAPAGRVAENWRRLTPSE